MSKWFHALEVIQSLAQIGLEYTKDPFDKERFNHLRQLSVDLMADLTHEDPGHIGQVFANESGYQTPKVDCRAVIIKDQKLLLVKESTGLWALPGGWADIGLTLFENIEKEVFEEASLTVKANTLLALENKVPQPHLYPYTIYTHYVGCSLVSDHVFTENIETQARAYFNFDDLPELDEKKTSYVTLHRILNHKSDQTLVF